MLTLPRGPEESAQSWYATSRLGVYVCTVIIWGAGIGAPQCHYFIGRCKEKSGPYSLSIFKTVLEKYIDFKSVRDICWWADGGRHFRAAQPISTMCFRGVETLCEKSGYDDCVYEVADNFGIPSHFKNRADGLQAHLRGLLEEVAKKKISTIQEFVLESRSLYNEYAMDPRKKGRMPAYFHDYFPDQKRSDFVDQYCVQFTPKSFIEKIMVCQSYTGRLNDKRKRKNPTFINPDGVFTAIDFKSNMLHDGSKVPKDHTMCPHLFVPKVGPAAAEDLGEDDAAADYQEAFGLEGNVFKVTLFQTYF